MKVFELINLGNEESFFVIKDSAVSHIRVDLNGKINEKGDDTKHKKISRTFFIK